MKNVISQLHTLQNVLKIHAANLPTKATISRYGVYGKNLAKIVNADYKNVQTNDQGHISGGTLAYKTNTPEGQSLDQSTANLKSDGTLGNVSTSVFDRNNPQNTFQYIKTDFSNVSWSVDYQLHTGSVKITNSKPDKTITFNGTLTYDNTKLLQGTFNEYGKDGTLHGNSEISYEQTQFLGPEIVGGYTLVNYKRPDQSLASTAQIFHSKYGLPTLIHSKSYATNGKDLKASTMTDYSLIKFNARKEIESGNLHLSVQGPAGILRSTTNITFEKESPTTAVSKNYTKQGKLNQTISTNYQGAKFNNDNEVINSSILVEVRNAKGILSSKTYVYYNSDGEPVKREVASYDDHTGNQVISNTHVDYTATVFNHQKKAIQGKITAITRKADKSSKITAIRTFNGNKTYASKEITVQNPQTGQQEKHSKTIKRPDGTLAEIITTTMGADGKPISGKLVRYGQDGKTVIQYLDIDYTSAQFQNQAIVGGVILSSAYDGNNVLATKSKADFD